jgi:hypothetical protein
VRVLTAAIAISVAAHAAAIGFLWLFEDDTEDPVPVVAPQEPGEAAEADVPLTPITDLVVVPFVVLPRELAVVVPQLAPVTGGARAAAAPRIATGRATGSEAGGVSTGAGRGPTSADGKRMMTMRHPNLRQGVSGGFLDRFLESSKPLERADDTPERADDELKEARAAARRGDANAGNVVALAEARNRQELKAAGGGTYKADKGTFKAKVAADGTVKITDAPNVQFSGLGLKFDITDAAMRAAGIDPYSDAKRKFLDGTREQRVNIGNRYKKEQLSRSAEFAQNNVDRLWATVPDLAGRKQGLFDLWDDCEDVSSGGATGGDRVAGGVAARALIEGVIRARLTGPSAYTPSEIAKLNGKRRSRTLFVPYPVTPIRVEVVPPPES